MSPYEFRKVCTPDQLICLDMLCDWARGEHHLPNRIYADGQGVKINWYGDLSSYDFDCLTRLVILAHQYAIRVEIGSSGPRMVSIRAHRRYHRGPTEERKICEHHPSLDDLIELCRKAIE